MSGSYLKTVHISRFVSIKFNRALVPNKRLNSTVGNVHLKNHVDKMNRTPMLSLTGAWIRATLHTELIGDWVAVNCTSLKQ